MTRGQLASLRPLVENAGADSYSLPAEVVDAWTTFEAVKALPLPAPATTDFEQLAAGIVAGVGDGKPVDVVKAGRALHRAVDEQQVHDAAQRILVEAVEQAGTAATVVAGDFADVIVVEHLAVVLADIYEEDRG